MSTPSPPPQIPDIRSVRESLIADGSYVGYTGFNRGELTWTRDDYEHRLVTKSPNIPADESESFELSMIVRIPSFNFFLTSCAMWSGPNEIVKALHKAKASCLGQAPADQILASDYERAMMNIQYLIDGIRTSGVNTQRGLFHDGKIKFRHFLFEPTVSVAPDEPALTPECSLENWPADSPKVQPYLEKLKAAKDYRPIPLPAYDLGGDLIRPAQYKDGLQGATVAIYFTLCHYSIGEVDGLAADISYIRVLAPPRPPRALASTPLKRNSRPSDPKFLLTPMSTIQSPPPSSPSPPPSPSPYVPPAVMRDTARSYGKQYRTYGSLEYDNKEDCKPLMIEDKQEGSSKGVTARMRGVGVQRSTASWVKKLMPSGILCNVKEPL